jgi:hypothetical protein
MAGVSNLLNYVQPMPALVVPFMDQLERTRYELAPEAWRLVVKTISVLREW